MREVTSEWISKAEGDYRSAEILVYQIEPLKSILVVFIASNVLRNT
jgi:hypothetical protein